MMDSHTDKLVVIILAAGQGKRMLNPSKAKVMVNLAGKPLIEYVAERALQLSKKIYIIVGYQKQSVIKFINSLEKGCQPVFEIVEQKEQLGTGHAVAQTETYLKDFKGDVLILCGDVPNLSLNTLNRFIGKHISTNADVSVLSTVCDNTFGYGRIIRNEQNRFLKITEEKDANPDERQVKEINSGVYIIKSELLFPALKKISNSNSQGEYYLTDIIEILEKEGANVHAFAVAEFDELQGVNSPEDLKKAEEYLLKLSKSSKLSVS
ncbi:MAG: sugar phosphate nucleotidyltransferase [bacterium]